VLNVQKPDQGAPVGSVGSGGTEPLLGSPLVCVHDVGLTPPIAKSALWKLPPTGYENVTRPPAVIVTSFEPSCGFVHVSESAATMLPSTNGALALEGDEASP
jgi:hypothetical protein